MKFVIILIEIVLASSINGGTFYVSPTGGTGAGSIGDPWSESFAHSQVAASDTLIFLDGTYTAEFDVPQSFVTVQAQHKWKAIITNSPALGLATFPTTVHDVTIDGFQVGNSGTQGIVVYGSNTVVRNCWVHHAGASHGVNVGSGVFVGDIYGVTIEQCLLENNGFSAGFDHGVYLSGTNCIIRNNVCRGNLGFGIQLYSGTGNPDKCAIYNNLCYKNYGNSTPIDEQMLIYTAAGRTNSIFCNTLISTNNYNIEVKAGTVYITNNILSSAGTAILDAGGTTKFADYNLAPQTTSVPGSHDITSSTYGFVNSASGRYWITTASAGKAHALVGVFGAVDFFGNTQTSVADIGAFQYSVSFSKDSRILDPSPVNGADYWLYPLPAFVSTSAKITTLRVQNSIFY